METDFICAYFGKDDKGEFWTINSRGFSSLRQAEKHGLYMMPTAGVLGFAVISENEDAWILYDQFSIMPNNVSVSAVYNFGVSYEVTEAPKLVMV